MTDRKRYEKLSEDMHELYLRREVGSPRYMELWTELEQIKNRHGGLPPPKDKEEKCCA